MPELHDAVSDTKAIMSNAAFDISFVAGQLTEMGIAPRQAKLLDDIAFELRSQQKILGDSHLDDLDGQIQKGRETTGLILRGLLSGAIGAPAKA